MGKQNRSWKLFLYIVWSAILLTLTWAIYSSDSIIFQLKQQRNQLMASESESEFDVPGPGDSSPHNESLTARLIAAEINWKRANERRRAASSEVLLDDGVDPRQHRIIWDFFTPSFDCPFTKERIGRVGDGGKWICGFSELLLTKSKCVIFSFGVRDDTSFEEEILRRAANCVVHMFDPTVSKQPAIVDRYPGRAIFHPVGIAASNVGNMKSLKRIMAENNVEVIDVLKMDVEGAEWQSTRQILQDFPGQLPFVQLQIEVHLNKFRKEDWLQVLTNWWDQMEGAGLRPFFREPNLLNSERYEYRELAFLNVKREPFNFY